MAWVPFPDRRTLLAGLAALWAWPVRTLAAARPPKQVLAFYYGWYGSDGHTTLDNAPDRPVDGPYKSLDPSTLERQVSQAKSAGLTGLIASWWGQNDVTDQQLPSLFDAAEKAGLSIAVYMELAATPEDLSRDILYIYQTYGHHPAWLRLDGRPVIFLYDRVLQSLGLEGWKKARALIEAAAPKALAFIATGNGRHQIAERAPYFDGVHIYALPFYLAQSHLLDFSWPGDFYSSWIGMQAGLRVTTATVMPGYDDRKIADRPPPRPFVDRKGGQTFASLFAAAIAARPDWILIVSFNEWHEGSEIEPSAQYGERELKICASLSKQFLK